jgi:hypothetical protein
MLMSIVYDPTCSTSAGGMNTCGNIFIDTEGINGPHTWGKDVYGLHILPKA